MTEHKIGTQRAPGAPGNARNPASRKRLDASDNRHIGRLAQLGERLPYKQEVACSSHAPPIVGIGLLERVIALQAVSARPPRSARNRPLCPLVPNQRRDQRPDWRRHARSQSVAMLVNDAHTRRC